jgi:hypothetical protein
VYTLAGILIYCAGMGYLITHPGALPSVRPVRVAASLVALASLGWLGYGLIEHYGPLAATVIWAFCFLLGARLLALIWSPVIAQNLGVFVSNLVMPFEWLSNSPGGFRPDFRAALSFIETGNWEEARSCIEEELKKDPASYEGHFLMACVCQKTGRLWRARQHVRWILRAAHCTEGQKNFAREFQAAYLRPRHWLNLFQPPPPRGAIPARAGRPPSALRALAGLAGAPATAAEIRGGEDAQRNRRLAFLGDTGNVAAILSLAARHEVDLKAYQHLYWIVLGLVRHGDAGDMAAILRRAEGALFLEQLLTDALLEVRGANRPMIRCLLDHGASAGLACRKLRDQAERDPASASRCLRLAAEIEGALALA